MIVVRDVFQMKFGKSREALDLWKEGQELISRADGTNREFRMLTDMIGGHFYTLVLEAEYESLTAYEAAISKIMGNGDWKKWYQKFVPLAESGSREIYNVVQ